jgi:hypothetical protein
MRATTLASSLALAAALFSTAASAQTGRPSEAPDAIARSSSVIDTSRDPAGSYAHYLMLNGVTPDVAIRQAQSIDHPALRKVARHRANGSDAGLAATQTQPQ